MAVIVEVTLTLLAGDEVGDVAVVPLVLLELGNSSK